uniref:Hexosyltransferase n=1 Tax=Entomoneis paludosa TaxID=265537 RepID=A0A7S3DQ95_9STRA
MPILEQSAVVDRPKPAKETLSVADTKKTDGQPKSKGQNKAPAESDGEDSVAIPARRELAKPSKPLCDECLKVVEKAKPVDLTYVDMTGGHKEHPHLGAKDVNGQLGYIHDETHLRKNPPKFSMNQDDLKSACSRRDNNYKMLTEQVSVDFAGEKEAMQKLGPENRVKIFCLVYTTEKGHENIPRIRETWGQKCDGFMTASTKSDPSIDAVEIPHEGPEEYDNIWQKVRSMWSYIYDNYYETYDWFHIGGDDYYLLVENLRLYLESEEIRTAANGGTYLPTGTETSQTPLYLGRRFAYMGDMDDIFNSGGSGYTINKAALKTLVVDGIPTHRPHAKTFSEDTMVARLFKKYGIEAYETKDENGGERYMPFMPGHHYGYRMPADKSKDWYAKYSINIKEGKDHCAKHSIAFHYVKQNSMYRLHALLYDLCPPGTA